MKYLLIICSLLFFSCTDVIKNEHEFQYMDKVIVTSGFYKDCTGVVYDYSHGGIYYAVSIKCQQDPGTIINTSFNLSKLKKAEE